MRWLLLAVGLLAVLPAAAQPAVPSHPPAQSPPPAPCPPAGEPTDRPECTEGTNNVSLGHLNVDLPSTLGGNSGSGPESVGSLSGGNGEIVLLVLVAAAAVLPLIVYAMDEPAAPLVRARWDKPSGHFAVTGGGVGLFNTGDWAPVGGLYASGGYQAIAVDAAAEGAFSNASFGELSTHLLVRPPPRQHVELALAVGVRRTSLNGQQRTGLDLELPHTYAFDYIGAWPIGAYLRPGITFDSAGIDGHLHGGLYFPLGLGCELRLGARAFSLREQLTFGADLGFGASL